MNAALNLRERLDSQPKPPITTFRRVPDLGEDQKRDVLYFGGKEVGEADGSGISFIQVDHLGTPRVILRPNGQVHRQKFMPFGERIESSLSGVAKGYTGHEQTDASGLIYMQARFYLPMYGRFASPDPGRDQYFEDTQSWNIYSYVKNHPTMSFDPDGMQECRAFMQAETALLNAAEGRGRVSFDQAAAMHRDQVLGAGSPGLQKAAVATTGVAMAASGGYLAAEAGASASLMGAVRWLGSAGTSAWNSFKDLFSRGAQVGPAVQQEVRAAAQEVNIGARSLQHAFKHAADFGVSGNWNNANASAFKGAIEQHIGSKGTQLIEGTYRGQEVLHRYNSATGLNVITTKAGEFISGWKLSAQQAMHLLKDGKLGGN